jgi:hypothetical protein
MRAFRAQSKRAQAAFVRIVGESAKSGFSHESSAMPADRAKG